MQSEGKANEKGSLYTAADLEAAESRGKAEGARGAYLDVVQVLHSIGFGRVDAETGEYVEIDGADAVDSLAELYGRLMQAIGGEEYALQHAELLATAPAAAVVIPESIRRQTWAPERGQTPPKAEVGRCPPLSEVLAALETSQERGGDVDLSERVALLDDIIEQARQECQSRPKAEAGNVLRILAATKMETELGTGELDLAYRSTLLDAAIASARDALGFPGASGNESHSESTDSARTSE